MKKLLAAAVPAAALLLAGCGADSKSCAGTTSATLAAGSSVGRCSVAPGGTVSIPVKLCPKCVDSSPACPDTQWRVESGEAFVDINPIFHQCDEDRSCAVGDACELDPSKNQTSCTVTVPSNTAPGTYRVYLASSGAPVSSITVGSSGGCTFALAGERGSTP